MVDNNVKFDSHHATCRAEQKAAQKAAAAQAGLSDSAFIRKAIARLCANYGVAYPDGELRPRGRNKAMRKK